MQGKFRPVLFSPFSPSVLKAILKLGLLQYKNRLLLKCTHHFKLDVMNNMEHVRIFVKDYVRKFESGRIKDRVNQFQICIARKENLANPKMYTVF